MAEKNALHRIMDEIKPFQALIQIIFSFIAFIVAAPAFVLLNENFIIYMKGKEHIIIHYLFSSLIFLFILLCVMSFLFFVWRPKSSVLAASAAVTQKALADLRTATDTAESNRITYISYNLSVQKIVDVWISLAREGAGYNSRIFEYLYLIRLQDGTAVHPTAQPAYNDALQFLGHALDHAARAFKILTNETCAATLKCAKSKSDNLETLARDRWSEGLRGGQRDKVHCVLSKNKPIYLIADGTISEYVEDDLKSAAARGEYTNSRLGWEKDYNATIVCQVFINVGNNPTSLQGALSDMTFMICIDNKNGGLKTDICIKTARYIAYRISAMVYRAEMLKSILFKNRKK
jgi:hypothetical protein